MKKSTWHISRRLTLEKKAVGNFWESSYHRISTSNKKHKNSKRKVMLTLNVVLSLLIYFSDKFNFTKGRPCLHNVETKITNFKFSYHPRPGCLLTGGSWLRRRRLAVNMRRRLTMVWTWDLAPPTYRPPTTYLHLTPPALRKSYIYMILYIL